MSDDLFIRDDRSETAETKFCPLIQGDCLGSKCQWWVMDYMEDKKKARVDCAITMIAKGITDEALLALRNRD